MRAEGWLKVLETDVRDGAGDNLRRTPPIDISVTWESDK